MPEIRHYKYRLWGSNFFRDGDPPPTESVTFNPGTEIVLYFGPWDWHEKSVVVTADPWNSPSNNRALKVVETKIETRLLDFYLTCRIANVGESPTQIWYVSVSEIGD